MSKTEFNSYLIKAILHVLKQFLDKKLGRNEKTTSRECKINLITHSRRIWLIYTTRIHRITAKYSGSARNQL